MPENGKTHIWDHHGKRIETNVVKDSQVAGHIENLLGTMGKLASTMEKVVSSFVGHKNFMHQLSVQSEPAVAQIKKCSHYLNWRCLKGRTKCEVAATKALKKGLYGSRVIGDIGHALT